MTSPKVKSTPIDAARLATALSKLRIELCIGHQIKSNKYCQGNSPMHWNSELAMIIAALQDSTSSTHSSKADVEALQRVKTEIRLRIGDCEEDNQAWRKEPRNSQTVQRGIQANANRILAYNNAIRLLDKEIAATINSKESSE